MREVSVGFGSVEIKEAFQSQGRLQARERMGRPYGDRDGYERRGGYGDRDGYDRRGGYGDRDRGGYRGRGRDGDRDRDRDDGGFERGGGFNALKS